MEMIQGHTAQKAHPLLLQRKQVLLIEDDPDFSDVLSSLMQARLDLVVDVAADPFEAINKMSDQYYDAIVVDWSLPQFNAKQTLKRAEIEFYFEPDLPPGWDYGKVPVIVVSGHDQENLDLKDSEHFRVAGYVSKKQSLREILNKLKNQLEEVFNVGEGLRYIQNSGLAN